MLAEKKLTLGQVTSDFFTKLFRSWYFVLIQLSVIFIWISLNALNVIHLDPYPFNILKLFIVVETSFIGSFILMNQNRDSRIERKIILNDYIVNCNTKKEVDQILQLVKEERAKSSNT